MTSIKYVVFDYNGTLTNDAVIGYKACNHVLGYYNLPEISFKRFKDTFTTPWIDFYVANGVRAEDIDVQKHQLVFQKFHSSLIAKELKLNSGVEEVLKLLKSKGIILGILSSRNLPDLTKELKLLGIEGYFNAVVGEKDIFEDGVRAEKQVKILMKKLGISKPSEVLYIGDMIPDIKIAREYGFISGVIPTGWQSEEKLKKQKPDLIFKSFAELHEIIENDFEFSKSMPS